LRRRYLDQGASVGEIATELGSGQKAVRTALEVAGIPRRARPRTYPRLADHDWLRRRYLEDDAGIDDIAGELGCHPEAVRRALTAAGVRFKPRVYRRRYPRLGDHSWLRRRYLDEAASLNDLAGEIGCSMTAVRTALTVADALLIE
jgi:AraC-like DNA-binding protein